MIRNVRYLMIAVGVFQAVGAAAILLQIPFVLSLWPLPATSPLSYTFIASILAAAAASTLWCIYAREDGALAGIALDYIVILTPVAVFAFQIANGDSALTSLGTASAFGAIFGVGLLLWSLRHPIRDPRPMPRLVYYSFIVFVIALILVGGALVLKTPNIMPWPLPEEASVIFGWMFLGAAAYFVYSLVRPSWHNSAGQLAGFLAYDAVLILPFLQRLPTVAPELRLNLIIYLIVITYSGLLSIYYLFINGDTRIINSRVADAAGAEA